MRFKKVLPVLCTSNGEKQIKKCFELPMLKDSVNFVLLCTIDSVLLNDLVLLRFSFANYLQRI